MFHICGCFRHRVSSTSSQYHLEVDNYADGVGNGKTININDIRICTHYKILKQSSEGLAKHATMFENTRVLIQYINTGIENILGSNLSLTALGNVRRIESFFCMMDATLSPQDSPEYPNCPLLAV